MLFSPEAPFGKDSDTMLAKWYSQSASGWGMLWGFQDNSTKNKELKIQKKQKSKVTLPNLSKSPSC
jgi:hypothetical protein